MERSTKTMLLLALVLGQAAAVSLKGKDPKLSPPLKDVVSDKKFFGPPFPADYPEDKRPVVVKGILDKLKGPGQPYPALQSKADFDADYVKDENSDKGAWQAQFEYDALRKRLAQEEADERRAEERANREGRDVDGAQRDDDSAAGRVKDAQKGVDDAMHGEDDSKKAEDFGGPPSAEKLERLKKAVAEAEEKYEQQKKAFEECKRQLEAAKKNLEELKASQAEMEAKLSADTKLWAEKKAQHETVKFNLKKNHQDALSLKIKAAQDKLAAAEKVKADLEKNLAKEKSQSDKAQKTLSSHKASLEKSKKALDAAATRLQKLHGYKPVTPAQPAKSGAPMASALLSLAMIVAMQIL